MHDSSKVGDLPIPANSEPEKPDSRDKVRFNTLLPADVSEYIKANGGNGFITGVMRMLMRGDRG